jgi:hypothetical protein
MIATIPVIVALAGALIYSLSSSAKLAELGRLMFFAGLLIALYALHGAGAVRVLP